MEKILWVLIAFAAGAFLPIQAGINAMLSKAGGNYLHAAMISFIVGSLALAIYILLTKQTASWAGIKSAPAHAWVGGLLGAFYVTVIILCFQRLGPGLTFGTVVAGQMVISLILEHFSVFGGNPQPFNLLKLAGIALIVLGVILIKRF